MTETFQSKEFRNSLNKLLCCKQRFIQHPKQRILQCQKNRLVVSSTQFFSCFAFSKSRTSAISQNKFSTTIILCRVFTWDIFIWGKLITKCAMNRKALILLWNVFTLLHFLLWNVFTSDKRYWCKDGISIRSVSRTWYIYSNSFLLWFSLVDSLRFAYDYR